MNPTYVAYLIFFPFLLQQTAEEILEGLLEEDDEVVQVWYMMGLVNVYRKTEESKPPARFYLNSAKRVSSAEGVCFTSNQITLVN